MAITGQTLVNDAATFAGVLGQDQATLSDNDSQTILRFLNRMVDSWSTENAMIYAISTETLALSAGVATYLSSGLAGGRPVNVGAINVTYGGVNYDLTKIDATAYSQIGIPSIQAIPTQVYIDMGMPNATFTFFPVPFAPMVANVDCQRLLASTPITLTTSVVMPPGYERALVCNLAKEICPVFMRQVTNDIREAAMKSMKALKKINFTPLVMRTDFDRDTSYALANIYKPW
jgi:hypothetical protein